MFVDDFDLVCPYVLTSQCMSTHEALIGVHVVVHSFVECAAMVYVCVIRCFMYTFSHNSSYKSSSRLRSNPCAKQACCACMEHTTTFIRMFVVCICAQYTVACVCIWRISAVGMTDSNVDTNHHRRRQSSTSDVSSALGSIWMTSCLLSLLLIAGAVHTHTHIPSRLYNFNNLIVNNIFDICVISFV